MPFFVCSAELFMCTKEMLRIFFISNLYLSLEYFSSYFHFSIFIEFILCGIRIVRCFFFLLFIDFDFQNDKTFAYFFNFPRNFFRKWLESFLNATDLKSRIALNCSFLEEEKSILSINIDSHQNHSHVMCHR